MTERVLWPSPDGQRRFAALAERLPVLLDQLCTASPLMRKDLSAVPHAPGVYLLSAGAEPIYIGQTRDLRQRLTHHGAPWARENQATFAFSLARREALLDVTFDPPATRRLLATDPSFAPIFARSRERVGAMAMRYVQVADAELRTVFEVYAAVLLGTDNTFETH